MLNRKTDPRTFFFVQYHFLAVLIISITCLPRILDHPAGTVSGAGPGGADASVRGSADPGTKNAGRGEGDLTAHCRYRQAGECAVFIFCFVFTPGCCTM